MNQNQPKQEIPSPWALIKAMSPAQRTTFILQMLLAAAALTMAAWFFHEKPMSPTGNLIAAALMAILGVTSFITATAISFQVRHTIQNNGPKANRTDTPEPG